MGNFHESLISLSQAGSNLVTFPTRAAWEDQEPSEVRMRLLTDQGIQDARSWRYVDSRKSDGALKRRWQCVYKVIRNASRELRQWQARGETLAGDEIALLENDLLLQTLSHEVSDALKSVRSPAVLEAGKDVVPRVYSMAVGFLQAAASPFTERSLSTYLAGIQEVESPWIAENLGAKIHARDRPSGTNRRPGRDI